MNIHTANVLLPTSAEGAYEFLADLRNLPEWATEFIQGDYEVHGVRDDVYNLAIRMLWRPEDAEDATQEILVRIITHLGGFRGESSVRTWVYRVASNHLLTTRRRQAESREMSFGDFGDELAVGLRDGPTWEEASPERKLEIEEVKIGCSQAMLLCLDRPQRLAYVLGEVLELSGPEASAVLEISASAFRKRLSRARKRVHSFLRARCGLADPDNECRCHKRVERAKELGRIPDSGLLFSDHRRPITAATRWRTIMSKLSSSGSPARAQVPSGTPGTILGAGVQGMPDLTQRVGRTSRRIMVSASAGPP